MPGAAANCMINGSSSLMLIITAVYASADNYPSENRVTLANYLLNFSCSVNGVLAYYNGESYLLRLQ